MNHRISVDVATWSSQLIGWKLIIAQLYNKQIYARALIGQSAMVYCAGKLMEKSRVFWIII